MPEIPIQLFEEAISGLQRTAITGHYKNGISTVEFANVMFHIAELLGAVECRPEGANHLRFVIGNNTPRIYEFPVHKIFRTLLGSIAGVIWSQNPQTSNQEKFNPYGDKQEVIYKTNHAVSRFEVETANTNGKPLYFIIRRL
jgi:hypothetical protein